MLKLYHKITTWLIWISQTEGHMAGRFRMNTYTVYAGQIDEVKKRLEKMRKKAEATPQNTQKERPCGKIPPGRAYIRHSISAAAALI